MCVCVRTHMSFILASNKSQWKSVKNCKSIASSCRVAQQSTPDACVRRMCVRACVCARVCDVLVGSRVKVV